MCWSSSSTTVSGSTGGEAWTPLDEALYWSNRDIAEFLIDRGAEVRTLRTAAGLGDAEAVGRFFVDGSLSTNAGPIRSPFPDTVPDLVAEDPGAIVDNAFVMAVNNAQGEAARMLVTKGARVNAKPPGYHWHGTACCGLAGRSGTGRVAVVDWC